MAYTRLLRLYYSREAPIPLDPGTVFRLVRAQCRTAKEAVTRVLHEFFTEKTDGWHNKRADEEIAQYKSLCEFNQRVGKLGGRPKKTGRVISQNRTGFGNKPPLNPTNNHKPITNNQYKETQVAALPDWLPEEAWKGWLEMRRQKKTPNTPRALHLAVAELTRLKASGNDPATVIDQATVKGWKSFYPVSVQLSVKTSEPLTVCDYCSKRATGAPNGIRACDEHFQQAMFHEKPVKLAVAG